MTSYARTPTILEWDAKHFGLPIASFGPEGPTDVAPALMWAQDQRIAMMMARCDTASSETVHALESSGFQLMDTYVRYAFDFAKKDIQADKGSIPVRSFLPGDISQIEQVAIQSFGGYMGHFHADARLSRDRCDTVYSEWAANSCRDKKLADDVLVAVREGEILGFATMKGIGPTASEGILFGVAPKAQGLGIYRSFMVHGMRWSKERGYAMMEVGTQVNNYAVQKVWQRLGFEIHGSGHTFHRWFVD